MSAADSIALSKDEVRQLCRTPIKARQVAFLRSNGIRHYVDGHGWPVVLRATLEGGKEPAGAASGWRSNKRA
jgi:hypothetical protein